MITPGRLEELLQVMARWGVKELRTAEVTLVLSDVRPPVPQPERKPDVGKMVVYDSVPPGADPRLLAPELGFNVRRSS